MDLIDFTSPQELISWCYNNLQDLPMEKDNYFIFPPEIFQRKIGNCIDIAFLMHLYCDLNNIQNTIGSVDIDYVNNQYEKIINRSGHVICIYNYNKKWTIAQISGINDKYTGFTSCIFTGNNNIHYTMQNFGKNLLKGLIPWLREYKPNCIIQRLYYSLLTEIQITELNKRYYTHNTKNKQTLFTLLLNQVKHYDINGVDYI